MKKKFKTLGLAAIGVAVPALQNCSTQKQYFPTVEGNIQGIDLSEKRVNTMGYNLEMYRLFNGKNVFGHKKEGYDTRPRVASYNKDLDKGELEFIVSPREDLDLIGSTANKNVWTEGKKYIPTIFNGKNGKPFTEFEIYNIPKGTKKKLETLSRSFFGDVKRETGKMGGILPAIKILGKSYVYLDGTKGRLTQRDETGKIIETRAFGLSRKNLSELYIPLEQENYDEQINFGKKTIRIVSGKGFFLPITEKSQRSVAIILPKQQKSQTKKPCNGDCTYKIKKGDTYSKLVGKNWRELVKMNPNVNPNSIPIDQIIKIPCKYKNK